MSASLTISETQTFTVTHARHMAAKVATDLKRMQRLYGKPSDTDIANYELEIVEYLKLGYLSVVTYGYQRAGNWIEPTLRYTARDLSGSVGNDDDPGRIRPGANIVDATFGSYLIQNAAWAALSTAEKDAFRGRLPFQRLGAESPGVDGYLADDRSYSSGGRSLNRASVRSLA